MWAQCALARGHRGCWKILRSEHKPPVESWTTEDFWKSGAHDFLLFSSFFDSLSTEMLFTVLVFDREFEWIQAALCEYQGKSTCLQCNFWYHEERLAFYTLLFKMDF